MNDRYESMTEGLAKQMVANAYTYINAAMPHTPRLDNGTDRYINSGASTILAKAEYAIGTDKTVVVINNVIQYGRNSDPQPKGLGSAFKQYAIRPSGLVVPKRAKGRK